MAMTRNAQRTIVFPLYDATNPVVLKSGLTAAARITKDGGTDAVSTNAVAEVGTTGIYKLTLTATEMDADLIGVKVTATGACDQVIVLVTDSTLLAHLDADVSTRLATTGYTAPDNAGITDIHTDVGTVNTNVLTRLATSGYTVPPTPAAIADQVWDELTGDHMVAGSTARSLSGAASAGDPWTTALPGAYADGTAGKLLPAIKAKTDTLGAAAATVSSPMAAGGAISIIANDDYYAVDGRSFDWTNTAWPDLTGATATIKIGTLSKTGTILNPGTTNQIIRLELAAADTTGLTQNSYTYEVEVALANTHHLTLFRGSCTVSPDAV